MRCSRQNARPPAGNNRKVHAQSSCILHPGACLSKMCGKRVCKTRDFLFYADTSGTILLDTSISQMREVRATMQRAIGTKVIEICTYTRGG